MAIRSIKKEDLPFLKKIIESTHLFPSELLDEMTADFLSNPDSVDKWLTDEENGAIVSIAYYAPERLTEGTFNLYLIAVHAEKQGIGAGAKMVNWIEQKLRHEGQRVLIVETSSLPEYGLTRKFYEKLQYHKEAIVRDFYKEGEHKIIFWKKLNS